MSAGIPCTDILGERTERSTLSASMGGKSIVRQDLFRRRFTEFLAIVMLALISLVLAQISNLQSEFRGGEEG